MFCSSWDVYVHSSTVLYYDVSAQINMANPADTSQSFFNAHAAAQLAILPQFSNKLSDDKFTAAQWLTKVINHKEGAQWNDAQNNHMRKKCMLIDVPIHA
jgi:hypothetical protein